MPSRAGRWALGTGVGRHPCTRVHRARRLPQRESGLGQKAHRAIQNPDLGARRKLPEIWGRRHRWRRMPREVRPTSQEPAVSGGPLAWFSCCMRAPVQALNLLWSRWSPSFPSHLKDAEKVGGGGGEGRYLVHTGSARSCLCLLPSLTTRFTGLPSRSPLSRLLSPEPAF